MPRFNGKLFKAPHVLPLSRAQITLLTAAGRADWAEVEPAIFGSLLANEGRLQDAAALVRAWHHALCGIRAPAEELDAHCKARQAAHPGLTLTGLYNVLKQLHDELDAAVLAAYGWQDLLPSPASGGGAGGEGQCMTDTLLERLVALNAQRRREEAVGQVRWLRPAFQAPADQTAIATPSEGAIAAEAAPTRTVMGRLAWPATLPEQVAAVARVLAEAAMPLAEADIAARFTGKGPWKKRLPRLLDTLVALGRTRAVAGGYAGAG